MVRRHSFAHRSSRAVLFGWAVLFVAAALSAGCDEPLGGPNMPSPGLVGQLDGTWNLAAIHPAGQPERPTPTNARYTLTFAEGRGSTQVDCNQCNGVLTVSGQTLTVGPLLACTRALCATMAFGDAYTTLLAGTSTVTTVTGDTLVLSSARGVLRFTR